MTTVYGLGASFNSSPERFGAGVGPGASFERSIGDDTFVYYLNRVWDIAKSSYHYWVSLGVPDFLGSMYNGPGVFGVDTSGYVVLSRDIKLVGVYDRALARSRLEYEEAPQNLWERPRNPHVEDEEFESETLGPEWYAYSVDGATSGSFEYGAVNAYDSSIDEYDAIRLVIDNPKRRSWAIFQPYRNKAMFIGKSYTFPTNVLVWARVTFQDMASGLYVNTDCGLHLLQDATGNPDSNNGIKLKLIYTATNDCNAVFFQENSGSVSGLTSTSDVEQRGQALEYLAIHKIGTTYHGWVGTAGGNWIYMGSQSFAGSLAHVGFYVDAHTNVAWPGAARFGADFVRFIETDNFLL